jgi:AcrR family transcriptional regulator
MPRVGLTSTLVVSEAGDLADEVGFDNLTISALAQRLGVKQPTLYKHVTGTSGLHREMAVLAKLELADVLRRSAVGKSGDDALIAISAAYRTWATEHPGRYAATVRAAAPGDDEDEAAGREALEVVTSVLDGYGITGDDAIDVTRSLRAGLHGFVSLEAAGGFGLPADVDRSFERLVRSLVRAITDWRIIS